MIDYYNRDDCFDHPVPHRRVTPHVAARWLVAFELGLVALGFAAGYRVAQVQASTSKVVKQNVVNFGRLRHE